MFHDTHPVTARDMWSWRQGEQPEPFLMTGAQESGAIVSPDGEWIAYRSNESGQDEVYVQPDAPGPGEKRLIPLDGGDSPVWSPDGHELFYDSSDRYLTSVAVETRPRFSVRAPARLFPTEHWPMTIEEQHGPADHSHRTGSWSVAASAPVSHSGGRWKIGSSVGMRCFRS